MSSDAEEDDCNLFGPPDDDNEEHIVGKNSDDSDPRRVLVSPNTKQYDGIVKEIRDLITNGNGETIYEIGGGDDESAESALSEEDMNASVATLLSIATQLDCELNHLRDKGHVKEYLIREKKPDEDFTDIRVAVVGNVDAGKSTLLGVLTHDMLDDGRGKARLKLLRHKHEAETGRTSSIGHDILGFDSKGDVVNKPDSHSGAIDRNSICQQASKIVTFIDLAGHEKYLKTTVTGMTGQMPDFCMLMVGSNAGVVGMTKEHLGLALALNVPVFVVVTKIDMCPPNILQETMKLLCRILKSPGCRKIPVILTSNDDVVVTAKNFTSERVCPIFQVSNVTGENIALLKSFLNLLTVRLQYKSDEPMLYLIDGTYTVPNVGTTVSGTMLQGSAHINDILHLGPDKLGKFNPVPVKSIHRKMQMVDSVNAGQTASFALKKVKRGDVRRGMILASPLLDARSVWEFDADVLILHHATTMSTGYQAMVHCGCTRQTATIISMDQPHLRTGDRASCRFRFIKHPEYMPASTKIIFREGRTKAVEHVTKLHFDVEGKSTNNIKKIKKQERLNRRSEPIAKPVTA